MQAGAPVADRDVLADPDYRAPVLAGTLEALRQGGRSAAWELTLLARPSGFDLADVTGPVRLWQGDAERPVPRSMVQAIRKSLPYDVCYPAMAICRCLCITWTMLLLSLRAAHLAP